MPLLAERPSIIGYEWYWEAFHELSTCRVNGFSVGRIPWTAVNDWAQTYGLNPVERYIFHQVIAAMDTIFQDHCNRESEKRMKQNQTKGNMPRRPVIRRRG